MPAWAAGQPSPQCRSRLTQVRSRSAWCRGSRRLFATPPASSFYDAGVAWVSSDPSKVTIDELGVAVALAEGSTAITASAGGVNSAAVTLSVVPAGVPGPTSDNLIDAGRASGAIDAETALAYRVYAAFADARLPVQYRGDDRRIRDNLVLEEVAERFAQLSTATQTTLQPFFIPPYYAGSWFDLRNGRSSASLLRSRADGLPVGPAGARRIH